MHTPSVGATEGSEPAHGTRAVGLLCPPSDSGTGKMKTVFALCLGQNSNRFTLLPRCCLIGDPDLGASHLTVPVGERPSKKLDSKRIINTYAVHPLVLQHPGLRLLPPEADSYPILSSPASSCNFDLCSPSCFGRVSWPRVEKQALLWKQAACFVY